jgi:phage-related protein
MSIKRISLTGSNSTGNNVTEEDTLEATFSRSGYPITVDGTPTNCTVSPSSVASGSAIFTADFSSSTLNSAFSFILKNAGPNIDQPDFSVGTPAANNIGYNSATAGFTDWSRDTATYFNQYKTVFGHAIPYYSTSSEVTQSLKYAHIATDPVTGSPALALTSGVTIAPYYTQFGPKVVINQINYSETFSLAVGEKVEIDSYSPDGTGGFRAYLLDTVNGTWNSLGGIGAGSAVTTASTYSIVLLSGTRHPTNDSIEQETTYIRRFAFFSTSGVESTRITISGVVSNAPSALIKTTQVQETEDALVHLFELKLPEPRSTTLFMHDGLDFDSGTGKNIYFPSKDGTSVNEYIAFPITIDGLETKAGGGSNRPTLSMANIPVLSRTITNNTDGTDDETNLAQIFTDEGMGSSEDFLGGTLTYRTTLLKYILSGPTPVSLPIEYPSFTYSLDRVSREESASIQFELATPADLDNIMLPNRRAVGKYCSWEYQGALYKRGGCTVPANAFGIFFDEDDKLITANINATTGNFYIPTWATYFSGYSAGQRVKKVFSGAAGGWRIYEALIPVPQAKDPETNSYYWKRIDVCGKRIRSCKMRFHSKVNTFTSSMAGKIVTDPAQFNSSRALPFGGFPGSKKFK